MATRKHGRLYDESSTSRLGTLSLHGGGQGFESYQFFVLSQSRFRYLSHSDGG